MDFGLEARNACASRARAWGNRPPKKGDQMQLKASRTITLQDVSLKEIYDKLLAVLKEAEDEVMILQPDCS